TLDLDGLVVTLTYDDGTTRTVAFADFVANGLTASPGAGTVLTLAHNGTPVTITHTTSATAATDNLTVTALEPEVVSIAVTTQPTRLVYTERSAVEPWRNTLDLDGLVVTLTYNDGSSRAVAFADFVANGLTTNPADGTALALTHNGTVVTITHTESGETATTAALTVTAIRWGDVNNDNAVTLGDVSMLNLYVLGFPVLDTWMYRGDVNHDGDVTLGDVSLLNLYVLGFPVRITPLEATAAAALAPLAADRAIEFTVDTVTAAHGDRVEVNIFVKNNDIGFTSTNMTIEFDDTKVRLLGYAGGDIFPVQTGLVPNRFSLRAPDPDLGTPWEEWNLTDDGLLLTLSFEVLTDVEELVPIALTVETYRFLTDLDGFGTTERVPVEEILLVGGGINVTGIPVTHGLTLNLAGGAWPTGFTPPATVVNGAPMPTIPTPVRDGFTFTGWTPVLPETVTRPVTATAQWTAIVIPEPEFDITVDDEYGELTITVDPDGDYEVTVDEDGNIVITLPDANPGNEIVVNLPDDWDYDVTEDEDGNVIVVITPPEGYEVVEGEDGTLLVRPVREFHEAYMFGVRRDGTLYFDPTDNITRAQVAAILARTMIDEFDSSVHSDYYELPEGMDSFDEFSDVAPNNWFYHYVAWAYHEGLVQGIGGDRFAPNALITREQLAAMLVRTLDVEDRETAVGPTMDFPDAGTISSWAPVYVYNAFRQGWMIGDRGGNFRPAENIMRAEVATAVNRMLGRVDHNDVRTRLGGALENEYRAATFPDVVVTNWFFASVLGAANDHYLSRDGDEISWKYIRVQ
ncbi:MAG: S-layer homology domain-containing protein, partial [Oscillospiraceae bacterium]|nr:S-layer homology domain-containing protein [Oscillospiraceae bacterium]